ncbi:conserved hypothetical protein [Gloeothece citriformis PCC 7424]|uniref:Uncharacterized protein n=1 Tax=Gloeothece citriformis (strain PCC 7424) TaxID=65393 RepID=B7KKU9_GLOC7|nr:hypothetical protein [Gloeothece citriformis]ACK71068.1 conserved hypothetical protein [Gloeothece citriformis PCC 7424]
MFINELQPVVKELIQQPIAFMGGFVSGVFRLRLSEDPLKTWLDKQGLSNYTTESDSPSGNGSGSGPQSITIE